jgi:large subunit ribosomal protein L22
MEIKVKLNNLRTAPRKTRLVADLVRGKKLAEAQNILSFTINKTAKNVLKLLNSAAASAKNDFHLDQSNLFVSKITVDEGPKLKRWHPMSRGRAYPIIKRTSHICLVLSDGNKISEEKNEKQAVNKPEPKTVQQKKPKAKKIIKAAKEAKTKKKQIKNK